MQESAKKSATTAPTTTPIPAVSEVNYLLTRTLPFADHLVKLVMEQHRNVPDLDLIIALATQLQENLEEAVELSQGMKKVWRPEE